MKKILSSLILCFVCGTTMAKDIKIVLPFTPGGPNDKIGRLLGKVLNNADYNFVFEYKLGAGGGIASNYVASIKNETVLLVTSQGIISNVFLTNNFEYNLEKDFILVDYIGAEPQMVLVKAESKINSFKDLQEAAKTEFMPYGTGGVGSNQHIASAIVAGNNKNFTHIPYKGSATLIVDMMSEQFKWMIDSDLNVSGFIKEKKIKPIAVYFNKRLPQYPDVPTLKELGFDDKNFYRWHILVANSSADPVLLNYIRQKMSDPLVRKEFESLQLDTTRPKSLNNFFRDESSKIQNILKETKLVN